MSEPTVDAEPSGPGYDGWAIIDLGTEAVVRVNAEGSERLGVVIADLPCSVDEIFASNDPNLANETILSAVRAGNSWSGRVRLGVEPSDDTPSTAAMIVPHITPGSTPIEFASLLFGLRSTADAFDVVLDPLTGLATRSALFDHLERAVGANRDNTKLLVALFIDLDGLKSINDRFGHDVGDEVLIGSARRLASTLPAGALVVRFGGDEFVVIYESADDLDEAEELGHRLLDALRYGAGFHTVSASIGIAVSRAGEVAAHELIRRADAAMYRAKSRGGSQVAVFDAEMHAKQRADEQLRARLLQAVAENGLRVAAQPIFELATGRIAGVELFIRFQDHSLRMTESADLFRLAQEHRETFDVAVLDRAIQLARRWGAEHGENAPRIHLKVSSKSLMAPNFAGRVTALLTAGRSGAGLLAFEIDGEELATGGRRDRDAIAELRALGVSLVVDGFGHGALTLSSLADWEPTMIKLDIGDHAAKVLTALLRAASTLRVATCVSGIDNGEDMQLAVAIGAFAGQGDALMPVGHIEQVNVQLRGRHRIGF